MGNRLKGFFRKKWSVRRDLALAGMLVILAVVSVFSFHLGYSSAPSNPKTASTRTVNKGSVLHPPYFEYNHCIYSGTGERPPAALGEKLNTDGKLPNVHAIKGIDPSKSIAVQFTWFEQYNFYLSGTFQWNGVTYKIKYPGDASTLPLDSIGKVGEFELYDIHDEYPSEHIKIKLDDETYADAIGQPAK